MRKALILFSALYGFAAFGQEYFQQEVNYTINVKLNDKTHNLSAYEEFEYINNSPNSLEFIYVHLWPNAYKNKETALGQQLYHQNDMSLHYATDEEKGFIDSLDFKVDGETVKWEYDEEHIDICRVTLNKPLAPGGKMVVSTPFKVKIPSGDISRLGHVGSSYQITQWYPKPAVYDVEGWHQMPYLTQGEFYSEYGSFDVSITLPSNYVVGSTGDLQTEAEIAFLEERHKQTMHKYETNAFKGNKKISGGSTIFPRSSDSLKTIRYVQKDVHDFAWFADKRFEVLKGEVELPITGRKVTTWAMFVTHHYNLWEDAIEYLNDGTYYYSKWNGEYPYNQVTAVDGTISAGGGMEYPNVTVIGNASSKAELEVVIVHEVGHNWFYGLLGSNERDHGWMDEGLNTLNELRYIRTKYPNNKQLSDMMGGFAEMIHLEHLSHHDMSDFSYSMVAGYGLDQPIETHSAEFTPTNYGAIMYSKTGLVLTFLKDYLSDSLFDASMQTYYDRWHYKHPQPEDLKAVFEEVTGEDLSWVFHDLIETTAHIDHKICGVKQKDGVSTVTVKNVGQVTSPVRVDALSYGKVRETKWIDPYDGKETVTFDGTTFDQFVIDYDKNMPEVNRNNNSWRKKGLIGKQEKVEFEFLGGDNERDKSQVWWSPAVGANKYDKFMIGAMFHNITIPKNKFEYTLIPMFSVGGPNNFAGYGDLKYSWVPKQNIKTITLGVTGKSYANGLGSAIDSTTAPVGVYYVAQPYLEFHIGKPVNRTFYKQKLRLMGAYVFENANFFNSTTAGGMMEYTYTYNKGIHGINGQLRLDYYDVEQSSGISDAAFSLMNVGAEITYNLEYWESQGKGLEIRAFFGQNLMYNGPENSRYGFAMSGQSGTMDVFYEHTMGGRNEVEGMYSNQRIENQGGFRSVSNFGISNSMLFATNLYLEIPYAPIGVFADYGIFDDAGIMVSMYNMGLGMRIKNRFGIYFPVLESANIQAAYPADIKYWNKIRFTLDLRNLTPEELVRQFL